MGKMTDALRKAKLLKGQKIFHVPAAQAPAEPAADKPAAAPAAPVPAAAPAEAPRAPSLAAPPPAVATGPSAWPIVEEPFEGITAPDIVEGEPAEAIDRAALDVGSPGVVEGPVVRRPKAEPPRAPARKPARPTPLRFETVEEPGPAAAPEPAPVPPKPAEVKIVMPPPEPEPPKPVEVKIEMPAPEPTPPPAPIAWSPEAPAKPAAKAEPVVAPAPNAEPQPVLPAVEPVSRPARVPYLSVHYGRDERLIEQFRRLKSRLNEQGSPRVILVASARRGEGKTAVALNLAASFANTFGERVVVVDGNLARPKLAETLDAAADAGGVVAAVRKRLSPESAARKTEINGLWLVPSGAEGAAGKVEGLLDSDGMRSLLQGLKKQFTRVIVELPAAEDSPEGLALAKLADVVLVPVMKTRSRRKAVRRLVETLKDRGAPRVACVFVEA